MGGLSRKQVLVLGLLAALGVSGWPVNAEPIVLDNMRDSIPVTLQTPIDAEKSQYGDPFRAVVGNELAYKDRTIPQGTTLTGEVVKFQRQSYYLGFPAWVEVDIESAILPDGKVIEFVKDTDSKIYAPETRNLGETFREQLPLWVVSGGASIPLRTATELNGGVVTAIATGARVLTGIALELTKGPRQIAMNPPQFRSTGGRIGYGTLRGIGAVTFYRSIRLYPQPHLVPGDEIELRIDSENLERMFNARVPRS